MKVTIRWSGNNNEVEKTRVQHFSRVAKRGGLRGKLPSDVDTLWIGVTDRDEFETDGVLYGEVVLVANGTIRKEADANSVFFHRSRVYLSLANWKHLSRSVMAPVEGFTHSLGVPYGPRIYALNGSCGRRRTDVRVFHRGESPP